MASGPRQAADDPVRGLPMSRGHVTLLGDANSVHVQRWVREMQQRGWTLSLVTARPQPIEGVEMHVLRPVRRTSDWLFRVDEARRAVAALRPDILHAHYITSYGYLAARCAHPRRVMTAWGTDLLVSPWRTPWLRWLTAWTLGRARWVSGDSADLLAAAERLCPATPRALIHWGVDRSRFQPAPWAEKPALDIVSLRSWEPNYRIDLILEAVAQLAAQPGGLASPLHLHLLGGGSLASELREQVRRLGLSDRVTLHGRLDDAGMAAVMRRCKLSISVPLSDATSVSVLESMACGLAVMASDLPANRCWLAPRMLVPAGDGPGLGQRLMALAADDAALREEGQRNAERIARDGDRRVQMDAVDRLYQALMAGPGADRP